MTDRVLVLNCGSSSLKWRLLDKETSVGAGLVERIGEPGGEAADHGEALASVLSEVDTSDLAAVGHRVVHGGTAYSSPAIVDESLVATVRRLVPLAPLHNPANLAGIEVARRLLP